MQDRTVALLESINHRFYDRHALDFAASRAGAWPGWERLRPLLEVLPAAGDGARILDVACGNGRLAAWLGSRSRVAIVGVDRSLTLLARAPRSIDPARSSWVAADIAPAGAVLPFVGASFSAALAFGVFHHIASAHRRRNLLAELARVVGPGGLVVFTSWQFGDHDRFRRRLVPWREYNRRADQPIDEEDLEPGDHLLAWGDLRAGEAHAVRYCHHLPETEVKSLLEGLPFQLEATYRADGREGNLNLYAILRRRS